MTTPSTAPMQPPDGEPTINTAGGAYVGGNVFAETFIGRDQYNYYFVGLAPLVHDPTRRFRNFLTEYLGTAEQAVPFGGRQAQLDELHSWLNDVDAPPYYLMTAEAGRGKSALVCRWMEEVRQQRPTVEVIFIPISIRFETAAQDVVFAALAARLAQLYDEPLKPAALSGAQWQGVCESYLDRTPPAGKQLLIILDGLDEATGWHFGSGFFSTNPSLGLRVLVTARLRVGESTPHGWAVTLGWQERLTRMATLPPLTSAGVEEALASMGDPLAGLADQVEIVEQLYRLTEGDPLLVRLYVQELEKQKATVGNLNSAALQQKTPGLQGYFDQWWKGQKAQWRAQGSDPEKEEANLRLLLDALSAALGPLTLDDLANLHPALGSSRLIRALLQSVERWVIGDGKTQGYSYSHPRLGYYFWEQLSHKEQTAWDGRFCGWGATTLTALNAGQLDPKAAPVYLLRHYAEHLKRSKASAKAFYALISNGWRLAWEQLDVSFGGFLDDVAEAWEQATQRYDPTQSAKAWALIQAIKAALCHASVIALGTNLPAKLLAQAVQAGLRSPAEALATTKLAPTDKKKMFMLSALAPYLPANLLIEATMVTRSIEDESSRAKALVSLIPHLPAEQRPSVLNEALAATLSIQHGDSRSDVLVSLIPHLPAEHRLSALVEAHVARSYGSVVDYAKVLASLASHLPAEQRPSVFAEALAAAHMIKGEPSRAEALVSLAPHLPAEQLPFVLAEALAAARMIKGEAGRAEALASLALHLPAEQRPSVLAEALAAARMIKGEAGRVEVLVILAPHLPAEQCPSILAEALAAARMIKDERYRVEVLVILAPHLPAEQCPSVLAEALMTACSIRHVDTRSEVLGNLAPQLPTDLLAKALVAARSIEDTDSQAKAFASLASYLPTTQLQAIRTEVLESVRTIEHERGRTRVLGNLTLHRPLLKQIVTAAHSFWNELSSDISMGGIWVFDLHHPITSLVEALRLIRSIRLGYFRTKALGILALNLPAKQRDAILAKALKVAISIENVNLRDTALCSLNPQLPAILLAEELVIARSIGDEALRVKALGQLAPHLPTVLLVEALSIARSVKNEVWRTQALVDLVPRLPVEQRLSVLEETLTAVCSIQSEDFGYKEVYTSSRVEALGRLAQTLADWVQAANGSAYHAWCKTLPTLAARPRPQLLSDLATLMPFILALAGDEAPQAAEGIYHAIQEVCAWWP